jgi:hypothetical protein
METVRQEIDGGHRGVDLLGRHERGCTGPTADVGNLQAFRAAQTRQGDGKARFIVAAGPLAFSLSVQVDEKGEIIQLLAPVISYERSCFVRGSKFQHVPHAIQCLLMVASAHLLEFVQLPSNGWPTTQPFERQ